MPKILFTRTPSEAEGGPSHKFVEGGVFEVSAKSARRWVDEVGCAVPSHDLEEDPKSIFDQLIENHSDAVPGSEEPVGSCDLPPAKPAYEAIESGGEAPPIIVDVVHEVPAEAVSENVYSNKILRAKASPKVRHIEIRHRGHGMFHVFVDGKQITDMALPREEASALAEKVHADDLEPGADLG